MHFWRSSNLYKNIQILPICVFLLCLKTQDPDLCRHEADHGPDVVLVYSLAAAAFFALSRIRREINFYMKKNIKIDFLPSRFGK